MTATALQPYRHLHHTTLPVKDDCYFGHVQAFRKWCAQFGHDDHVQAVPAYFRALNQSGYRAGTIRMKQSAIKNRLRIMADASGLSMEENYRFEQMLKRLGRDPETAPPKTQKAGISSSKMLSETEYNRVISMARSRRQALFARFLWNTGCRISELTGAELRQCQDNGSTVEIVVLGKGRKERTVKIQADLFHAIRSEFRGQRYLFETTTGNRYARGYITGQLRKLTKDAIGRPLGSHAFRHSWATLTIARTGKIQAVSQYMGHASAQTTMDYYCHEQLSDADLFGVEATQ